MCGFLIVDFIENKAIVKEKIVMHTDKYLNNICRAAFGDEYADSKFDGDKLTKALESNCTPEALDKTRESMDLVKRQIAHRKELPEDVILFR